MEGKAYLCPRLSKPGGGCGIHFIASLPFILGRGRFRKENLGHICPSDREYSEVHHR